MAIVDAVIAERTTEAVRAVANWGRVRAAYLFGSQVEGAADERSDLDVAVFIEGAEHWDFDRVSRACAAAQHQVGLDVELHIFPALFYENPPRASFAQYILAHGVPLNLNE